MLVEPIGIPVHRLTANGVTFVEHLLDHGFLVYLFNGLKCISTRSAGGNSECNNAGTATLHLHWKNLDSIVENEAKYSRQSLLRIGQGTHTFGFLNWFVRF
jgi:hypothetical protein